MLHTIQNIFPYQSREDKREEGKRRGRGGQEKGGYGSEARSFHNLHTREHVASWPRRVKVKIRKTTSLGRYIIIQFKEHENNLL